MLSAAKLVVLRLSGLFRFANRCSPERTIAMPSCGPVSKRSDISHPPCHLRRVIRLGEIRISPTRPAIIGAREAVEILCRRSVPRILYIDRRGGGITVIVSVVPGVLPAAAIPPDRDRDRPA